MKGKFVFSKYRKLIIFILTMLVIFLFAYSIYGTAEYLGLFEKAQEETTEENEKPNITSSLSKKKNKNLLGNTSGNLGQHYSTYDTYGLMVTDDKYVYKTEDIGNDTYALVKYSISDLQDGKTEGEQLITGYKIHSLFLIDSDLYFVSTTQNDELDECEAISRVSNDGNDLYTYKYSESKEIKSFITDGEYLYFSNSDTSNIYGISIDGNIHLTLYAESEKKDSAYLFGFIDNKIYYVNGYEMATLNVQTGEKAIISTQYCSKNQSPFIYDNKIYVFNDLAKTKLDVINIEDLKTNSIFDNTTVLSSTNQYSLNITNINCIGNYMFINSDEKVYYIDLNSTEKQISLLKETMSNSKILYLTDKYIITESEEYGKPQITPITWLLAK